jgi:methionyl-tRNA formyltransferase
MAELLVAEGFPKPLVFTYPRAEHERDRVLLRDPRIYKPVFETCERLGIEVVDAKLTDRDMLARMRPAGCSAVFSLSWRRVIKPDLIDAFPDRIFNLHPSLLPRERGSGTFSYRIMNNSAEVSATIHLVGPGLDQGEIVLQRRTDLKIERPKPRDFLIATNELYQQMIGKFLSTIKSERMMEVFEQDADDNTYLPLLHTETNGAIDWSWRIDEIERFIRAFGDPYPGAFTFCKDKRLAINEAEAETIGKDFHPYLAGRVLSVQTDGSVKVIARGGLLVIREISIDGDRAKPAQFLKAVSCLHTPVEVLAQARATVLRANQMGVPKVKSGT